MTSIGAGFGIRGENIDVFPAYEEEKAFRIVLDEDRVDALYHETR